MPRGRAPLDDPRRCQAKSSRTGEPCTKYAIKGAKVCGTHGGRAPNVKKAARERLDALVDPAIAALREVLVAGLKDGDLASAVRAAIAILDRTGYHPKQAMELTGANGGPVQVEETIPLDRLSAETKRMVIRDLERWEAAESEE